MNKLNRRQFLEGSISLATGFYGASLVSAAEGAAVKRRIERLGLQLYTMREEMDDDFEGTLARVAELGYSEVEFAGYFDRTPIQVRKVLDTNGLVSPAAHIPWQAVRDDLDFEIERALVLGQKNIVIPYLAPGERTESHYKQLIETLNLAGESCKKAGLRIGYHNHDFEFQSIKGVVAYDLILEETEDSLVDFELDLYWIAHAGVDPIPYFEKYPGRFTMLHVKDRATDGNMVAVGNGEINFQSIFTRAELAGVKHYFVEHDNPTDAFTSVSDSYRALSTMTF
ncbi:sugar phosphate isomerase/epimerase [bacterium]|nr:sugar phosphate isomerase/epimerase [bacterium]MDB2443642.1 sugar phosphate isomerase/epimerase [Gammaproteobacteria bacterium]